MRPARPRARVTTRRRTRASPLPRLLQEGVLFLPRGPVELDLVVLDLPQHEFEELVQVPDVRHEGPPAQVVVRHLLLDERGQHEAARRHTWAERCHVIEDKLMEITNVH